MTPPFIDLDLSHIKGRIYDLAVVTDSSSFTRNLPVAVQKPSLGEEVGCLHRQDARRSPSPVAHPPSSSMANTNNTSTVTNVQTPSPIIPGTIQHKVAKADSAAAFVLSHAQHFQHTMDAVDYEGEYEILVGLIGGSTERIILLFNSDLRVPIGSLARHLNWVTKQHGCTLFTPSASLYLPNGSWIRHRDTNPSHTNTLCRLLPRLKAKYSLGQRLSASVSDVRYGHLPPPGDASNNQGGDAGSSGTGKPASSSRAGKGKEKAPVEGVGENPRRSPSSSNNSSVSQHDSGNDKGGQENICEGEYGEPMKKLKVLGVARFSSPVQASRSAGGVFDESSEADVDIQVDFDLNITACANPDCKMLTIPDSDGYKLNTAMWTKVDIKHLTLLNDSDDKGQGAWYYMEKLKLFVGSTPIGAFPIRFGEWKISSPGEVRVKNEESKGIKGAVSAAMAPHGTMEGSRGKTNTIEAGRDTLHLYNGCKSDIKNNTTNAVYVWRQFGVDPNTETMFHLEGQHAPSTVFNYRKVKDTNDIKSIHVATRASWSIMPNEGRLMRPWLLQRFSDKRKKPLHADLIHTFNFGVELARVPESRSEEEELVVLFEATEPEGLQGIKSEEALRYLHREHHPKLSLHVDFGQSIRGTTSKGKAPLRSFREKVSSLFKKSSGSNLVNDHS